MGEKKRFRIPHTFVIIFALIVLSALVTFLVPGGEYNKETLEFSYVDSQPQSWQILTAFYKGFTRQAGIIVFILVIGAAFWVVNSCKAIDAGIYSFLSFTKGLERHSSLRKVGINNIVIVLIMLMFSLFGAIFGMSEETIAFTIIIIPLAVSMGYDSIVGIAMVYVAAHVGFSGAILNPFTIGIAQDIAGLPIFSGIEYRFFCWIVLNIITIAVVLWYANRVHKNPHKSPLYLEDKYWRDKLEMQKGEAIEYHTPKSAWAAYFITLVVLALFSIFYPHTSIKIGGSIFDIPFLVPVISLLFAWFGYRGLRKSVHFFVLYLLFFTIIFLIVGVMGYGWYIGEISALFLALGILSGIAANYSANEIVAKLTEGAKDILSAALVVGLAAGIIVILEDAKVVDTILHSMSMAMAETGKAASLGVMYMIQTFINIVIPSASAKAAITMPIMAPFSDLIGVSRQATVLAFQFGDGFTNIITPTSGILIAVLSIARVPYSKWFKLILPFIILLIVIGFLLLLPTIYLDLNGF
ncbi:MAG: short-chain fatty acid transporter [Bacteroidetes bacterium RIFOXYA12_FULL_40_10]|nr:MAG: short-chain fatty acid transporter [Bacteroidetes bacterium RIFOXYA12_FULL_40_10]